MSFSWTSLRRDLRSFSASVSSRFSLVVSLSPSAALRLASLICSERLMIVSKSVFRLRKPSMLCSAAIAAASFISRLSVVSSTLTRRTLSQRLASRVALVPLVAMARIAAASS